MTDVLDTLIDIVSISELESLSDWAFTLENKATAETTHDSFYLSLSEYDGCEMQMTTSGSYGLLNSSFSGPLTRWSGTSPHMWMASLPSLLDQLQVLESGAGVEQNDTLVRR